MDTSQIPLFSMMAERLDWLSARQKVISRNVANADTPGYQAEDMKPQEFGALVRESAHPAGLATTSPTHLAGTLAPRDSRVGRMKTAETTPSGNSVSLEDQMSRLAETQMDYATITNLYRKNMGMIRLALGVRG